MILLIIISNNILLSLLIAFIYYFIFISLFFLYTKSYLSIIGNWFFYITLLKNLPAIILLLRNIYNYYFIAILIFTSQHSIYSNLTFPYLYLMLGFELFYGVLILIKNL